MIRCDEIINAADSALKNGLANFMSTVATNFHKNGLLYSAHSFISDHITIFNCYCLLSLYKT